MSAPDHEPEEAKDPAPSPESQSTAPTRKPRRWRRWAWRGFLALVVLVVLGRIALPFVLPTVLDRAVADLGLRCTYDDIDLSMFGGEVSVWGLTLTPRGEAQKGPVLAHLEYAHVNLDISALFTGELRVHRMEVDGLDLRVERTADGELLWLRHLPPPGDPEPEAIPEVASEDPPEPLDLRSPVRVDAIRMQHLRLHLIDPSVAPAVDTWIETNVRISDIGVPSRSTRIEVDVRGENLLDRLGVEGSVECVEDRIDATFKVVGRGIRLNNAGGWLATVGITPRQAPLALGSEFRLQVVRDEVVPSTVDVTFDLTDAHLGTADAAAMGMDSLHAEVQNLGSGSIDVPTVEIQGVRGRAERLADQALLVCGLEIRPAPGGATPTPAAEADPAVATAPGTASPPSAVADPLALTLETFRIADAAFAFHDHGIEPSAEIDLVLEELLLRDLSTRNPSAPATLQVRGGAPGLVAGGQAELQLTPFAAKQTCVGTLRGNGITLARLAPYLAALGLEPEWQDGTFACKIDASAEIGKEGIRAGLQISDVVVGDGEELFAVESVSVADVFAAAAGDRLTVESVSLAGVRIRGARDEAGLFHALGLRTRPATPVSATSEAVATATPPTEVPAVPEVDGPPMRIEVGAVRFVDLVARFDDAMVEGGRAFATSETSFEIENLALGGPERTDKPDVATLRAKLSVDGVVGAATIDGSIQSSPGPLDLVIGLAGKGSELDLRPLAPYLVGAGIEPTLAGGTAKGELRVSLRNATVAGRPGMVGQVHVAGVELAVAGQPPLVSLGSLDLQEFSVTDREFVAAKLVVDQPQIRVERTADGAIDVAGIRIPPPPVPSEATPQAVDPVAGTTPAPSVARSEPKAAPTPGEAAFAATLKVLELRGARLAWSDRGVKPAVETAVVVECSASALTSRVGTGAMPFDLRMVVEGAMEQARVRGQLTRSAQEVLAELQVQADGLRAGVLTPYIPEGIEVDLEKGAFRSTIKGRVVSLASGLGLGLDVTEVDYRDGEADPLFSCDAVRIDVPTMDLAQHRVDVAEVSVRGVRFSAERSEKDLSLMGIRIPALSTRPAKGPAKDEAARPAAVENNEGESKAPVVAAPSSPGKEPDPWHVKLDKFELEFASLRLRDTASKSSSGGVDGSFLVHNVKPWVLVDDDPEALPPLGLQLKGAVTPGVESFVVDLEAAPFRADASVKVAIAVDGIKGPDLTAALPSVFQGIDMSDLPDGLFRAKLGTEIRLRRRHPLDFDLARGFGLGVELTGVELRPEPKGPVLIGVDAVQIEANRIRLGGKVHIASIEVETPRARILQDDKGIHVAGLTLPMPSPAEPSAVDGEPAKPRIPAAPVSASFPPKSGKKATPAAPEIRIDRISVNGIDVVYRDEVVQPPVQVPLTGLDLQVDKFTTLALTEEHPISFSMSLETGKVPLPKRHLSSSAVAGLLTGVGRTVVGENDDKDETQDRLLLDEIAVDGRLEMFPVISGRVRTNISGLELAAFRGLAAQSGVTIGDGVFDAGIDTRIQGLEHISTRASMTLGYLSVDEAAGGPISSYLKLPAPLQSVVFMLRDDADEIHLPVNIDLHESAVDASEIAGIVAKTLSTLIVNAVAASPLRVAGSVTGLIPGMGPEEKSRDETLHTIQFRSGDTVLDPSSAAPLRDAVAKLGEDEKLVLDLTHSFGPGDLERVELLANPSPEQAAQLTARLRQKRAELTRDLSRTGAELRSHYAVGRSQEAEQDTEHLRRVARELAKTEDALDRVLKLLRPGAERRRDRRTRRMAIDLGTARLEAVRKALVKVGGEAIATRIEVRRARFRKPEGDEPGGVSIRTRVRKVTETE